jgi:hypothetical protein
MAAVSALLAVAACTSGADATSDTRAAASASISARLERYTDPGDGCEQTVSALGYAEFLLKPLGQERYQDWDDATLSRVAAVAGTIELEMTDYPDEASARQARTVADLATIVVDPRTSDEDRVATFREYRREAAQMVIVCAAAVDGI